MGERVTDTPAVVYAFPIGDQVVETLGIDREEGVLYGVAIA